MSGRADDEALVEKLAEQRIEITRAFALEQAVGAQAIELGRENFLRTTAEQALHNASAAEAPAPFGALAVRHARDPAQRLAGHRPLDLRAEAPLAERRVQAVVAVAAPRGIRLAEVPQNGALPAVARVGPVDNRLQLRAVAPLLFRQRRPVQLQLAR